MKKRQKKSCRKRWKRGKRRQQKEEK